MKSLLPLIFLLLVLLVAQVKAMSDCFKACFDQDFDCNENKRNTLNKNCQDDLLDCKLKCEKSG